MEQVNATWRKSSYSGSANTGNCVEVGTVLGLVAVRDTKDNGKGSVLRFKSADWSRLVSTLKR